MGLIAQLVIVQFIKRHHFFGYSVLLYPVSGEYNRCVLVWFHNSCALIDSWQLSVIVHFHVMIHVNIDLNITYR